MYIFIFLFVIYVHYTLGSVFIVAKSSNGIVIGTDTLFSQSGFISSRSHKKIYDIDNGNIVLCCVSGERDFHSVRMQLENQYRRMKSDTSDDNCLSIDAATHYCRRLMKEQYPNSHIIMIGKNHGHRGHKIFEILPQGTLLCHDDFAVSGAGSEYVVSLMNEFYEKERALSVSSDDKLSISQVDLEALKVRVRDAMKQATKLDHRSRGVPKITVLS